jgi:hypothetical protein
MNLAHESLNSLRFIVLLIRFTMDDASSILMVLLLRWRQTSPANVSTQPLCQTEWETCRHTCDQVKALYMHTYALAIVTLRPERAAKPESLKTLLLILISVLFSVLLAPPPVGWCKFGWLNQTQQTSSNQHPQCMFTHIFLLWIYIYIYIYIYIGNVMKVCLTVVIWLIGILSGSTCSKSMHCWPIPRDSHRGELWLAFWHALRTVHLKQKPVLSSWSLRHIDDDYGVKVDMTDRQREYAGLLLAATCRSARKRASRCLWFWELWDCAPPPRSSKYWPQHKPKHAWRLRVKYWCSVFFWHYVCTWLRKQWWKEPERAAWETGQDIKWQVKWLRLSIRLLGTLRYIMSIIFRYPVSCDIRQTFGPGGAGYRRSCQFEITPWGTAKWRLNKGNYIQDAEGIRTVTRKNCQIPI